MKTRDMTQKIWLTSVVVATGLIFSAVQAQETYRVGSEATFAPFEYMDVDSKEIVGFEIDLMKAIGREIGVTMDIRDMGFDGLIPALQAGSIDVAVSGMTITEARKRRVLFTTPHYRSGLTVTVRQADTSKYKTTQDVKGLLLCAQIGTTGANLAQQLSTQVRQFNNSSEAFIELQNKGCEAFVNDKPVTDFYLSRQTEAKLVQLPEVLSSEDYGLAVARNNKKVHERLETGLKKVRDSGEYDRIYTKWFGRAK